MKKILYSLLAGLLLLGPMSCKKDDPAAAPILVTAPEADAADDDKSGGVYKGVFVGSSGTIKIVLQGGKKEVTLKIDGVTRTLTTTSLDSWNSGQDISGATFTSGDWSVNVSIPADGSGGQIMFNIPGHPSIVVALLKERSTKMITAFEGTYAGSSKGNWNFIIQDNIVYGVSRSSSDVIATFYGSMTNNTISVGVTGSNVAAIGALSGNTATGTWSDNAGVSGTWTGTRTL